MGAIFHPSNAGEAMDTVSEATLESLAGGAAAEMWDHDFSAVLENIQDPNTPATAKRTIILEVVIAPHEDREGAEVRVSTKVKLAPMTAHRNMIHIGRSNGRLVAVGFDPRQGDVFRSEADEGVTPLTPSQQKGA